MENWKVADRQASLIADVQSYSAAPAVAPAGRGAVSPLGQCAAVFVGVFSYLVSYGLLLTFGIVALLGFGIGFATLPSATDALFPSTPTPAARVTPTRTLDNRGIPIEPAQATSNTASSPWAAIRMSIRLIVFGAAFLALWPGWFGGYVVFSRLRGDAPRGPATG